MLPKAVESSSDLLVSVFPSSVNIFRLRIQFPDIDICSTSFIPDTIDASSNCTQEERRLGRHGCCWRHAECTEGHHGCVSAPQVSCIHCLNHRRNESGKTFLSTQSNSVVNANTVHETQTIKSNKKVCKRIAGRAAQIVRDISGQTKDHMYGG